jgi:hypothetical protein
MVIPISDGSETTHETVGADFRRLKISPSASRHNNALPSRSSFRRRCRPRSATGTPDAARHLTFAEEIATIVTYIPTVAEFSSRELSTLWWRPNEFARIRTYAKTTAYDVRLEASAGGTRQGIDQGYRTAHYIALTTEECELAELLQQHEVVASHAKALVSWSACDITCRGLEHWASKSHWAARHEALDQVRDLRKEMAKQNRRDTNTATSWATQFAEYSRPSRIMARLLGHADEVAAIQSRSEYTLRELEEIIAKERQEES